MSTKKRKGPLLYIHQPFARTPATNMQDTYTIRQELVEPDEEMPSEDDSKKTISLAKKQLVPEQITKDMTKFQNKKQTSLNRVKPFKEMNLEERLDYLINYPKVLPPAPCVFVTEEKNYQGYLIEYDSEDVTIRFHDQTTKTMPVHALKNVLLIGLKKQLVIKKASRFTDWLNF